MPNPFDKQVGGDHYNKYPIQPIEYTMANQLDPLQHTIIKYVTRFRDKNGVADLEKAKHCIDMLIEWTNNGERPRWLAETSSGAIGREYGVERTPPCAPNLDPREEALKAVAYQEQKHMGNRVEAWKKYWKEQGLKIKDPGC